jgi:hypothetical protein
MVRHRTWTCTTRRATAGPHIPQASGKLALIWLQRRWRLGWFFSREAGLQVLIDRALALQSRQVVVVLLWMVDGGRGCDDC